MATMIVDMEKEIVKSLKNMDIFPIKELIERLEKKEITFSPSEFASAITQLLNKETVRAARFTNDKDSDKIEISHVELLPNSEN